MAFAIAPTTSNHLNLAQIEALKAANANTSIPPDPIYINQGGDTIASATVIPGIPYADAGTTANYASNYESCVGCFSCPYSSTGARDVVYVWTDSQPAILAINIDLCLSSYDTKVYVTDGNGGPIVGCNDDACGSGLPGQWQSLAECVPVFAGHTYYIFVDGYSSTDFGNYQLSITECQPCTVPCPPGSLAEGEPVCYDDYYDSYNGGCNSVPPVFTSLPCSPVGTSTVVCATYGGFLYSGLSYRDTDWYEIVLTAPAAITWCVEGEYDTLVGIINGSVGCPVTAFYDYNYGGGCTPLCVSDNLPAGTWWLWCGTLGFGPSIGACGGDYVGTLTGYSPPACNPIAVEPTSWGQVKNLYR
jgi:hypothetical protein